MVQVGVPLFRARVVKGQAFYLPHGYIYIYIYSGGESFGRGRRGGPEVDNIVADTDGFVVGGCRDHAATGLVSCEAQFDICIACQGDGRAAQELQCLEESCDLQENQARHICGYCHCGDWSGSCWSEKGGSCRSWREKASQVGACFRSRPGTKDEDCGGLIVVVMDW